MRYRHVCVCGKSQAVLIKKKRKKKERKKKQEKSFAYSWPEIEIIDRPEGRVYTNKGGKRKKKKTDLFPPCFLMLLRENEGNQMWARYVRLSSPK